MKDNSIKEIKLENGHVLKYVESEQVESQIKRLPKGDASSNLGCALENNSDLVPNVYEGEWRFVPGINILL